MREQPLPDRLQSSHAYEYDLGLFDHDPLLVVNARPTTAVPLMVGDVRICGTPGGGDPRRVAGVPLTYAETGQPRDRTPLHDAGSAVIRLLRERSALHAGCLR